MTDHRDANHPSSDLTFLSVMDDLLASGITRAGQNFRTIHTDFLVAAQQSDGGFVGPGCLGGPGGQGGLGGPSDLYYTRFAVEALAVLGLDSDRPPWHLAGEFLGRHPRQPRNVVDCLSLLQTMAVLQRRAAEPPAAGLKSDCSLRVRSCLDECRTADGGFAVEPGGQVSPYYVFLAALCYDLMGEPLPSADDAVGSVLSRRCEDGGFSGATAREGQTNQTAAAVALLVMAGALDEQVAGGAADFLLSMQTPDGGLRATAAAPCADLMSTFTGLYTLALTDQTTRLRLGQLGRFVRSLRDPSGGFRPVALGGQVDVEYTFYGLGAIGLLGEIARQQS